MEDGCLVYLNVCWLNMLSETYREQLKVVSLNSLEKIGDPSLKSPVDEDTIAEMVQQDCSESIWIT